MHGEYKVPGGKLVVVDFDVVDGVIRNPRVAGDFFLEPDEALEDLNRGLDGLAAASDAKQIAAAITGALRPDAVMLGFSAEAIAVAVRRAMTDATSWSNY
nr:lipoate--protein ligase family protein [Actinomycetota bacterium]